MDYQTHRRTTKKRQSNIQKHANANNFANHKNDVFTYNSISNPIEKLISQTQNQLKEHNLINK